MKNPCEARKIKASQNLHKIISTHLLTDIIPYRLHLTTLGLYPVVFELEIEKGYKAKCFIDDYKKLVGYLEIKYDPTHKFVPLDFFEALNKRIPEEFTMRPDYKDTPESVNFIL